MLEWLQRSGDALANDRYVIPLYLWSDAEGDAATRRHLPVDAVRTIAFFGRLEARKGVDLFLEAILSDALADAEFDVVFLGKPATRTPEDIRSAVQARRPDLLTRLAFETDLDTDQAQRYLVDRDCVAVIPSLIDNAPCVISECLRRRIPFLSTRTGGIPELIAEIDLDRVLVRPEASELAVRLRKVIGNPFAPVQTAYTEAGVAQRWREFFAAEERASSLQLRESRTHYSAAANDVAVVITHYERPALLSQALHSLAAQTVTGFEVVVVDDGSSSDAARMALSALERRSWPFRLNIVRQTNRYLGAARNAGIKATEAARLIFMDDDNLAFPNLVEILERAQRLSGVDIVTSQMNIFRDAEQMPDPDLLYGGERWAFTAGPSELGLSINCFGDATGIYRRDVFERIGYFHEWRGIGHEDWHLHARAALAGLKSLSLPVPVFWYRRTPGTMLNITDRYTNNRIIWDVYQAALPPGLSRFVDLAIRNDLVD